MSKRLSWAIRLERAEKRGRFFMVDKDLANEWPTCAIGEKHGGKFSTGRNMTEVRLGNEFWHAVDRDDIAEAKRIYQEIVALP